jgi:uncharacterized protein YecT (DUF1311 family)
MRLSSVLVALTLGSLLAAGGAMAQNVDCSNAQTTVEINFCAERDLNAADAALNAVYKVALAKIAKSDGEKPYDPQSWEAALRASQRAWVAFRDAECKGLEPMEWSGGTGSGAGVLGCLTRLTHERTQALKERFTGPDGPPRVP